MLNLWEVNEIRRSHTNTFRTEYTCNMTKLSMRQNNTESVCAHEESERAQQYSCNKRSERDDRGKNGNNNGKK